MSATLTLTEVENRYPNGVYVPRHGSYYFLDQDGDLGLFIGMADGTFENETNYVDFETIDEDDAENAVVFKRTFLFIHDV